MKKRVSQNLHNFFGFLVLSIALTTTIFAQATSGRISGTIKDPAGAIISGVTVTIKDEISNLSRTVVSDDNGFYISTNLPAGTYTISIEQQGFKQSIKTGNELVSDGRLTVDFALETGAINEIVEVQAATGETVNNTSGEVARVIDREQVDNLALNTRNFVELLSVIPGAVLTTDDPLQLASSSSSAQTAINGNRTGTNNITVDGGYNLSPTNNASIVNNVGIDFIQEVKIQTSNFSAEYGRNSGAAVNLVTRGGGNKFRGTAFEFLRNDAVDARFFFSPDKPALRYNNFGYSFGGPILKNKLFFFGGQEWKYIRRSANPVRRSLPTLAELNGDFSVRLRGFDGIVGTADDGVLRDPRNATTTCVAPTVNATTGVITRAAIRTGCFGGNDVALRNRVPTDRITTDGRAIAGVYRKAIELAASYTDSPIGNNALYQAPIPFDFRQNLLRLDYKISENQTIYGRYINDINDYATQFGPAGESQLPVTPMTRFRPGVSWLAQHTWLINSMMTNELRASVNTVDQNSYPVGDTWLRSSYGFAFPQVSLGEVYDDGIPDVAVQGLSGFRGPTFALIQPTTEIALNDNLTMVRGNHTMKFGMAYFRSRLDQNGRPRYTGNVSFTAASNPNTTNNAFADVLLGNFRTYQEAEDEPVGFFRGTQFDVYALDTWKLGKRLSLEYGVRIERSIPYYAQANNMTNFDPALYDPAQAVTVTRTGALDAAAGGNLYNGLIRVGNGVPESELGRVPNANTPEVQSVPTGALRGVYEPTFRFAPRMSFALAPFDDNKTAIRGGFGIFYDRPIAAITTALINNPPFNGSVNLENGNIANPTGGVASARTVLGGIGAIATDLQPSYVMNFSLGVQRELPFGLFGEISYVGNLGRHLLRSPDINQVPLSVAAANFALPTASRAVDNALRPYKGFSTINYYTSDTNSNYNSLQLYVTKRKGNFRYTGSYTWSKALTDASNADDDGEDPFDRKFLYGPASFDRRHIFVSTYSYRLPFLRKSKGFVNKLFYGYEVSGITRLQSGPFLTVVGAASTGGTRRVDYIGGDVLMPKEERGPDNWINPDAFAVAPSNRRGTAGVGIVPAAGMQVWNFSIRKRTPINERFTLRLQADIFNAFNRANFTSLSPTLTSVDFGQYDSTGQPRQIQFGIKLEF